MLRASVFALGRATRRLSTGTGPAYTEAEELTKKIASYFPRFCSIGVSREDEVHLYALPEHMDKVGLFLRDSAITQMKTVADASTSPVAPPK
mmetsp:Transcript_18866/g.44494  ORF Transcript_18866/g.44494 Transcript_18866/m.44494 type:complete len:92 (-) Transcript_18866:350-625(-)